MDDGKREVMPAGSYRETLMVTALTNFRVVSEPSNCQLCKRESAIFRTGKTLLAEWLFVRF
jgi:hypothetical protein